MRTVNFPKIGSYLGAMGALIIYLLVWLLPVSYLTGVVGTNIGKYIFGNANIIVTAISMIIGIIVASSLFIALGFIFGWICGTIIDSLKKKKDYSQAHATATQKETNEILDSLRTAKNSN